MPGLPKHLDPAILSALVQGVRSPHGQGQDRTVNLELFPTADGLEIVCDDVHVGEIVDGWLVVFGVIAWSTDAVEIPSGAQAMALDWVEGDVRDHYEQFGWYWAGPAVIGPEGWIDFELHYEPSNELELALALGWALIHVVFNTVPDTVRGPARP